MGELEQCPYTGHECHVQVCDSCYTAQETIKKRTQTHSCDNQYCIQNGGDICDRVHCPIGQKQTFYDDITDEQEQLDFVQKHERIPVVIKAETHGDVINRQAAIDASCRDWCGCTYANCPNQFDLESERFCDGCDTVVILKNLPSAEPEIITCKNCRHNHDCSIQYHAQAGEEFYCGAAERRTDEKVDIP